MMVKENVPKSVGEFDEVAVVERWILSSQSSRRPDSKPTGPRKRKEPSRQQEHVLLVVGDEEVEELPELISD